MSYKAVARQSYGQRKRLRHVAITSSHHFSFKVDWEANLEKAIAEAQKFKDQGYLVDECIEKGAFLESEANRVAKRLKDMGYETQLIPVARWAGENVVFIIYKPPKEPKPTPSKPKASPKPETEKVYERFLKTFWSKTSEKPDPQDFANKGYAIDPGKYVALIVPNAPSADPLVKMLRDEQAKGTPPINVFDNTPKLQVATTKNKNAGSQFVVFDTQGRIGARIRYFREALKVLGKGKIKVFSQGVDLPIYLVREDGHAIAIAPPTDLDVSKAVTIDSLVMQSRNP
ncbi:MAG: hypothetical protein QXV85_09470 [Candidatus Bathyarchaeia archaeon]